MNGLINLLCSLNINNADVLEYTKRLKNIQIKKGEHFQMQGCPVRYMGYVDSGKFRYYKIDKEGNERTLWFNKSFPFIGDYHSFLKRTNAELCIQAMEDYEIVLFNYEQMMELFDTNIDTQKLRTTIAERSMFGWRNIALALYFDTAEERYIELLNDYPDIEKEIPLKHIASTLGISPETLSRIRKKLDKNP
ncbi:Crp/Fnr family transcriptional regulator [Parabacteroides distasonis]|uniref:Crp/Fnr family transcriptional regulator n=2 Tax=Bacteroidales TaxID=171549 RepID=A0A2V1IL75_9BACT|nr:MULTISPECIES: Crp/Fnr family transcriptional regulator [Bacteroidales]NPD53515.1 Crp/Fnr family transcriptional regulator [Prevotella sp. PTAC]NUK98706.1 Crp/Fnr family transcriptional regulator [Phocaeicola sartorii]PWB03147.1 Crp/Fnr family transcriptional regulator [Duncaniella muris]QJE28835.1 Crp/Fnr family transcriptional regulator [Parabacteroides distasonis]GFZ39910.1 cAMP-binding protein [Bacteroides nordii]